MKKYDFTHTEKKSFLEVYFKQINKPGKLHFTMWAIVISREIGSVMVFDASNTFIGATLTGVAFILPSFVMVVLLGIA